MFGGFLTWWSAVNAVCPDMCSGSWSLDLQQMVARRGGLIKTHTHRRTAVQRVVCVWGEGGGLAARSNGPLALIRVVRANHFKSWNNSF